MHGLSIQALAHHLPFGVRAVGIDLHNVRDPILIAEMNEMLEERGLILFEGVEPSNVMQAAISEMFGQLKRREPESPIREGRNADGFVDLKYDGVSEVNGEKLMSFLPWHFDQCYTKSLTKGGVLRAVSLPTRGGITSFADGIQLYSDIDPCLREKFDGACILYDSRFIFWNMKFGRPPSYRPLVINELVKGQLSNSPGIRSIHPAIWQRTRGERVLHISPMQAAGIEGMENLEGDNLLEEMCQEIYLKMVPYSHSWKLSDMVVWDNTRFIHSVSGHPVDSSRDMRRTVIYGDYGLGRFERDMGQAG